jgi:antitoxin HigA-1
MRGEKHMNRTKMRAPSHPGQIIRYDYLEPLSITITELAEALDVSRKTISKIVNGRASVSPEMALRLGRALNTSPALWVNLQREYDLWHAAHDSDDWKKIKPIEKVAA